MYRFARVAITKCPMPGSFNKFFLKLLGIKSIIKGSADLASSDDSFGLCLAIVCLYLHIVMSVLFVTDLLFL